VRRREFITLIGGAAVAWPLAARAQQQQLPVIGILSSRSRATDALLLAVIRQGLNDTGFVENRNVSIEYRWAEGNYNRLAALAADLVGRKVAVIVTIGGDVAALAAKAATATLPVVFTVATDPVRSGLVSSLHRPGGNLTGHSAALTEMERKRLGLLRELRPDATSIGVLVNPNVAYIDARLNDIRSSAASIGREIVILNASTIAEIDAAFATIRQMRAEAFSVAVDPFFFDRASQIVVLAARHAVPALYFRREFAAVGGLMSYGSNAAEGYRVLGVYAGRILKGEKPGDLPIQLPTKFELVINLSTARALALEVPPSLLARADPPRLHHAARRRRGCMAARGARAAARDANRGLPSLPVARNICAHRLGVSAGTAKAATATIPVAFASGVECAPGAGQFEVSDLTG
jgi:putative tryptophan/tyrosine transport system substrate-binding protein